TSIKIDTQTPFATYALSPDSRLLAVRTSEFNDDQNQETIRILDSASGRELKKLKMPGEGTPHATGALAFSADGKWIAAQGFQESIKASIHIYDVASGRLLRELNTSGMFMPAINLDVVRIASNPIVFSSTNKLLALGGSSGVQLWDPSTGEARGILRTHIKGGVTTSSYTDQPFAQYEQQFGMTEEDLSQMSTDASNMMETLNDPNSPIGQLMGLSKQMARTAGVAAGRSFGDKRLQFSPDGRWIVTEKQEAVYIWDVSTGSYVSSRSKMVAPVAFSPDGTLFAAMEFDPQNIGKDPVIKDLIIRDTRTLSVRSKTTWTGANQPEELGFSPDGKSLEVLLNGNEVRFLDVDTQKQSRSVMLTQGTAFGTAVISPNGRYAAYGGQASAASAFPMAGLTQMGQMSQKDMEKMAKEMSKKMGKDMKKMSENMMQMMTGGGGTSPYQIKIFDLQSGQPIHTLSVESPQASQSQKQPVMQNVGPPEHRFTFGKNGTLIAVEDTDQQFPAIKIYETASASLVRTIRLSDRQISAGSSSPYDFMKGKRVLPVFSFSPDGTV
ncbi:MAG TPA: WD40 repeat domain-containing protein, partial [Acidobacteriota bacterium]